MPDRMAEKGPTAFKDRTTTEYLVTTVGGIVLAFNAGYLNGTTMEYNGVSTTHVSGTATRLGRYISTQDTYKIQLNGVIVLSFLIGSFITGCIVTQQTFYFGHTYGKVLLLISAVLGVMFIVEYSFPDLYWFEYLAAVAAGMQNALWSRYTGNIMRTTHVTGTTTDIGLFLGRRLVGDRSGMWKVFVLICMYSGFFFGSFIAGKTFPEFGQRQLYLNVIFFFIIGMAYLIYTMYFSFTQFTLWEALFVPETALKEVVMKKEELLEEDIVTISTHHQQAKDRVPSRGAIDDVHSLHTHATLFISTEVVDRVTKVRKSSDDGSGQNVRQLTVCRLEERTHYTPPSSFDKWDSVAFNLVLLAVVLLAFNAGFINGTCQSAPNGTSVTHMTSNTSNAALNLAASRYEDFGKNMGNILSFLVGAIISGTLVPCDTFHLTTQYGKIWMIGFTLLVLAAILLEIDDESDYSGFLCSLVAGLQNAMASKFSGCVIRTTHVSGSTSDLGSLLAKVFVHGDHKSIWKVKLLACAITAFIFGGYMGGELYPHLGKHQLFACVGVYVTVGLVIMILNKVVISHQKLESKSSVMAGTNNNSSSVTSNPLVSASLADRNMSTVSTKANNDIEMRDSSVSSSMHTLKA